MRFYEIMNEGPEIYLEKILKNPKFRSWFAGSKVVDKSGQPLLSYHWTSYDGSISAFDPMTHFGSMKAAQARSGQGYGDYDPNMNPIYDITGGHTMAVILSIKNPARYKDTVAINWDEVENPIINKKNQDEFEYESIENDVALSDALMQQGIISDQVYGEQELHFKTSLAKALKNAGYDGLVYHNETEGNDDSWVITDPNQVWNVMSDHPGS